MINTEKDPKYAKSRTHLGTGETKILWLIVLAGTVFLGSWVPTSYVHRSLFPTEDPKYIRRVYADHTVGQTFHTRYNLDQIRVFARAAHPLTQSLHAEIAGQNITTNLRLTAQDQSITLSLSEALPPGEYHLTLSAPQILEQADAILVRFQVASTFFEPGYMVVDGQESYGDIGFELVDRIPAWQQVPRYFFAHPNHAIATLRAVVLAAVLGFLTLIIPKSDRAWRYSLIALFAFTVAIRIPTLATIDGVFGGDAFNYLSKTKAWLAGDDPFSADPRKAPFLPFLLIPTYLTDNPLLWSRFIGAAGAGVTAAAVAAVLRRLRVSFSLALLGGLLVAVNRQMWWESLNGLANVPYAAVIALSTLSLVQNAPASLGLFTTLAALTRYEGILVSAVYLPALWLKNRFRLDVLRRSLVPLILLAVPFVFWPITGALGIRTAGDILGDSGLYIAWDWGDYLLNLGRAKQFLLELWFLRDEAPLNHFTQLIYVSTLAGTVVMIKRRPALGISLLLATLLQIAAVTAILPKTRYYVQIIPAIVICCVYGISLLPRRLALITASLLVAGVWINTRAHLPELLEDYNSRAHSDSVLVQTAVFFKKLESRPAFAINFLPVETFLPRSQTIFGAPEGADEQLVWLREKQATHLVETTAQPWFEELLKKYPQHFTHETSFKASYDPTEATIYRITGL